MVGFFPLNFFWSFILLLNFFLLILLFMWNGEWLVFVFCLYECIFISFFCIYMWFHLRIFCASWNLLAYTCNHLKTTTWNTFHFFPAQIMLMENKDTRERLHQEMLVIVIKTRFTYLQMEKDFLRLFTGKMSKLILFNYERYIMRNEHV